MAKIAQDFKEKEERDKENLRRQDALNEAIKLSKLQELSRINEILKQAIEGCKTGEIQAIEQVVKESKGVKIAFTKNCPLHIAAQYNQIPVLELLMKNNFNPYMKNQEGKLAVELAVDADQTAAIELLEDFMNELKAKEAINPERVLDIKDEPLIDTKSKKNSFNKRRSRNLI